MKRVRILMDVSVDGVQYRGNQVVDFPNAVAEQLLAAGSGDDDKEAVAYCMDELGERPVQHGTGEADEAPPKSPVKKR